MPLDCSWRHPVLPGVASGTVFQAPPRVRTANAGRVFDRQTDPFLDRCIVHGWFLENPLDQAFGRFSSERAVHQEQGLRAIVVVDR